VESRQSFIRQHCKFNYKCPASASDIQYRVAFWKALISKVVAAESSPDEFGAEVMNCMAAHVNRTHSGWLQLRRAFGHTSIDAAIDDEVVALY
jgi:hypothetical protein